jgi:hypothetical protein
LQKKRFNAHKLTTLLELPMSESRCPEVLTFCELLSW